MRVLITGAGGQVGYELLRLAPEGFEVYGLTSKELDITDPSKVKTAVDKLNPDLIINAAAYTAVDKAEVEIDKAYAVNRDGVAHLAEHAERLGIPLLHISTDYVFSGDADRPYRESDPTAPQSVYGASKLAGEEQLSTRCSKYAVLRTSWVFGVHGNNFVKTMLRLGNERDALSIVADQHGCPTSGASIARALWMLATAYREKSTLAWGIYHYSGSPACTWYDFAQAIFDNAVTCGLLDRKPVLSPIATTDYPTPAHRPAWSVMDTTKLQQTYGIHPGIWSDDLKAVLNELSKP